jgi:hypothetical protein
MNGKWGWAIPAIVMILSVSTTSRGAATLVHHWTFDGNALDSVGTNNGIIFGATNADGILAGALQFDGINDYVRLPQLAVTSRQFTITAWANHFGQGGGPDHVNVIFSQRDDATGTGKSALTLVTESNVLSTRPYAAAVLRSTGSASQEITSSREPYNEWHHYAITVNADNFIFYIDGEIVGSEPNLQWGNFTTSIDYITIGRERWSGYDRRFFNGLIDDVRIYDGALSTDDIHSLAMVPAPTSLILALSGLVGMIVLRRR